MSVSTRKVGGPNWKNIVGSLFLCATFLSIALMADTSFAAIVRVQSAACGTPNGGAATLACTITAPANGNTLIAVVGGTTGASWVTSISQTGATWTRAIGSYNTTGGQSVDIWYASNVSGAGTTATINLNPTNIDTSAVIMEYSGLATSGALDQTATNNGGTATATNENSGTTPATTQATELWIGGFNNDYANTGGTNDYTATAPFALVLEATGVTGNINTRTMAAEQIVSATGTANAAATTATAQIWAAAVATFTAAAASGNLTIGNGTNPANANAQQGSTNQAIDSFTTVMSAGTGQISTLTLTTSAQFTAANVTNIRVYRDAGTLGVYDAALDTLVPSTYTIGAGTATITITTPENVTTTAANYLITVDIAAGATTTNTLTARVTGATGTTLGTPVYSDTASATLTITAGTCVRSAPTFTLSPTSANVTPGGNTIYNITLTNNDTVSFCSNSTFTLAISSETGTAANFVLPSSLSATSPNPCTIAPAGTCTATLTVTAQPGGTPSSTNTTNLSATDTTNHNTLPGSGSVATTIVAAAPKPVPAGNHILVIIVGAAIAGYCYWTLNRRSLRKKTIPRA